MINSNKLIRDGVKQKFRALQRMRPRGINISCGMTLKEGGESLLGIKGRVDVGQVDLDVIEGMWSVMLNYSKN